MTSTNPAAGAVWLNADMVSPYDYWQYWRNTEDGDVARFLKLFTVLPLPEIDRLAALKGAEVNDAKKVLATEATALVHGRVAADQAAETAKRTFEEGETSLALPLLYSAAPAILPRRNRPPPLASGARARVNDQTASSAVIGVPSENFESARSVNV